MARAQHSVARVACLNFVEPMKAKLVDSMPPGDWLYEIRFDSYRAIALRTGARQSAFVKNLLSSRSFSTAIKP